MRFEYELRREVECWKAIRAKIDERIAEREALADEQIRRRVEGRDT